jgi:hypothetical protein
MIRSRNSCPAIFRLDFSSLGGGFTLLSLVRVKHGDEFRRKMPEDLDQLEAKADSIYSCREGKKWTIMIGPALEALVR